MRLLDVFVRTALVLYHVRSREAEARKPLSDLGGENCPGHGGWSSPNYGGWSTTYGSYDSSGKEHRSGYTAALAYGSQRTHETPALTYGSRAHQTSAFTYGPQHAHQKPASTYGPQHADQKPASTYGPQHAHQIPAFTYGPQHVNYGSHGSGNSHDFHYIHDSHGSREPYNIHGVHGSRRYHHFDDGLADATYPNDFWKPADDSGAEQTEKVHPYLGKKWTAPISNVPDLVEDLGPQAEDKSAHNEGDRPLKYYSVD